MRTTKGGACCPTNMKDDEMTFLSRFFGRSARRRAYADMMLLDDHLLRDIGVSRSDLALMMAGQRTAHPARRSHE